MNQETTGSGRGGWRVLLRCLGLNAVALAVVLTVGEGIARLFPPAPARPAHHLTDPGRTFRYRARPSGPDRVIEYDNVITLNRFGFHGPDHEALRAPGMVRVAVIGDSMVEAYQVSREETLAARMEEDLPGAEVLGFGISGHTTVRQSSILARLPDLLRDGDTVDLPDLVVFAVHGPFALRQTLVDFVEPPALWRKGLSWVLLHYDGPSRLLLLARDSVLMRLAAPSAEHLAEVARVFRPDYHSALMDQAWGLIGDSVTELAAWCRTRGVRPVFAYIPEWSELPAPNAELDTDAVARQFKELVSVAGVDWVDITAGMRSAAAAGGGPLYFRWDQHLTARGHAVAAGLLAEKLKPLLETVEKKAPLPPPK